MPAFYAARLWEYPFAQLAAEPPFTIYLDQIARCDVIGVDPDAFEAGIKYLAHGVSEPFVKATGIRFRRGQMEDLPEGEGSTSRAYRPTSCWWTSVLGRPGRGNSRGQRGLCSAVGPRRLRLVTHLDVDRAACERAVAIFGDLGDDLRMTQ